MGPVVGDGMNVDGGVGRCSRWLRGGISESKTVLPIWSQDLGASRTSVRGASRAQSGVFPVRAVHFRRFAEERICGIRIGDRRSVAPLKQNVRFISRSKRRTSEKE